MELKKERKQPPLWLLVIVFFTMFSLISGGITCLFGLPWHFPVLPLWRITCIPFLGVGFYVLINALKSLKIKRAFGKEIYKSRTQSQLITTGIYAHTRNPLYLGSLLLFFGWFLVFLLTPLLIMTFLFAILFYFVARWEEKELFRRFGDEYLQYREKVPFFIPKMR